MNFFNLVCQPAAARDAEIHSLTRLSRARYASPRLVTLRPPLRQLHSQPAISTRTELVFPRCLAGWLAARDTTKSRLTDSATAQRTHAWGRRR